MKQKTVLRLLMAALLLLAMTAGVLGAPFAGHSLLRIKEDDSPAVLTRAQ